MSEPAAQNNFIAEHSTRIEAVIHDPIGHHLSHDLGSTFDAISGHELSKRFALNLHEQITKRAYEIAEQRGFAPGNEVEDWLRAEREVLSAPES